MAPLAFDIETELWLNEHELIHYFISPRYKGDNLRFEGTVIYRHIETQTFYEFALVLEAIKCPEFDKNHKSYKRIVWKRIA